MKDLLLMLMPKRKNKKEKIYSIFFLDIFFALPRTYVWTTTYEFSDQLLFRIAFAHLWHGETWVEPWVGRKKFGTSSDLRQTCERHWCWVSSCWDTWKCHKKYQSRNKSSFETKHEIAVQTAKWRNFFLFAPKPLQFFCRKIGTLTCRKHWCVHLLCKLYRLQWVNRWCHHLVSSKTP